jgi:hypothetical protein
VFIIQPALRIGLCANLNKITRFVLPVVSQNDISNIGDGEGLEVYYNFKK